MKKIAPTLLVLFALSPLANLASADHLVASLRVTVSDAFATRPSGDAPSRVVFLDGTPVHLDVSLTVAALPSGAKGAATFQLPSRDWWEHLEWTFERSGPGAETGSAPKVTFIKGDPVVVLNPGDRVRARLRVDGLEPGVYRLSATIAGLNSDPVRFLASSGNEDDDLRREYARFKVFYRSPDRAMLEANLRELAALDPLNAGPWIRLADLAVGTSPLKETDALYVRAAEVLALRREKFRAEGNHGAAEGIDEQLKVIQRVRQVLPKVYDPGQNLFLQVHEGVTKRYVVVHGKSGRIVETIGVPPRERE
jgi:hypothetical protein